MADRFAFLVQEASMEPRFAALAFAAISISAAGLPGPAAAATLATSDPQEFAAFVAGATRIGFDFLLDGTTPIQGNAVTPGSSIDAAALIGDQYASLGVLFSSTGDSPAVAVSFPSDAVSPPNLLAGNPGTGVLDYFQPILATFTDGKSVVGAHNDATGSKILLETFDASDAPLETVQANEGQYVGIARETADIASARFSWVQNQSQQGFTIDDFYVPEPDPSLLGALASGALAVLARRRDRARPAADIRVGTGDRRRPPCTGCRPGPWGENQARPRSGAP